MMVRIIAIMLVAGFAISFFICRDNHNWQLTKVSGHLPDLEFSLVDDNGRKVTEKDYEGQMLLLYFGFNGCGAECPLMMARLADIAGRVGDNVHILFVTVDPGNDTPEILHNYVARYGSMKITGLTGKVAKLAKRYRAAYQSKSLAHSNAVYIFDKKLHARLLVKPDDSDESVIRDLRVLSNETD